MGFSRGTEAPACAQYPPKVLPRQVLCRPSRCPVLRFVEALGSLLVVTPAVCRAEASAGAKPAWLPVLAQFPLLCLMSGGFPEVQRAPQASERRGSRRPSLSLFQRLRHPGLLTAAGREQHCVWPPAAFSLSDVFPELEWISVLSCPALPFHGGGCAGSRAPGREVGPMGTGLYWSLLPGAACTSVTGPEKARALCFLPRRGVSENSEPPTDIPPVGRVNPCPALPC